MKTLPIAARELRVASRRRGTWWVRFAVAGSAMGVAALVLLSEYRAAASEQAQILFGFLSVLAFLYALAGGVLVSADSVSEEKREGTLGLLFLTSLRGYDVVAGKLLAQSLRMVSGLVALLPVLAVPLLMGGIAPELVGRIALVLGNTLFLSMAVGVLVSVWARDSRHAVGGAIAMVLVLVGVLPLVRWLFLEYVVIGWLGRSPGGGTWERLAWVHWFNPVVLFAWGIEGLSMIGGGRLQPMFWRAMALQHGLGWVLFAAASVLLPRCWRDEGDRGVAKAGGRVVGGRVGVAEPYAWVVTRERRAEAYTWLGLGVVAVAWIWGWVELGEEWLQAYVVIWTLFGAALWLKLRVAAVACRHLHEHHRSGGFELVLCTAETPATIVRGQLRGMWRQMAGPVTAVFAVGGLLWEAARWRGAGDSETTESLVLCAAGLGILLLDLWTLAWAGMWLGLRSKRYLRAWSTAVGWVLLLPWVIYVTSLVVAGLLFELGGLGPGINPGAYGLLLWWLVVAVGVDAVLLFWSRRGLLRRFRSLVAGSPAELSATVDEGGARAGRGERKAA